MGSFRIGLSTQTPLLRFTQEASDGIATSGSSPLLLSQLAAGTDYQLTPGGVCRMVYPTVQEWSRSGWLEEAHWLSLQPHGPRHVRMPKAPLSIHHLSLPADQLAAYGRTKEKLWADIHGLDAPRFDTEDFRFYSRYNAFTTDAMLEHLPDLDLAYIHDFQLLQAGALIGLAAPTVLRWHVPFDPARIPPYTRNFLVRAMEDFDGVIVSTRRDLEGLLNVGYRGPARQLYPHLDVAAWPKPSRADAAEFESTCSLDPNDQVLLIVARMDPIKRQDLAIQALAKIQRKHPRARLVLVGNGSFSGSQKGGLGLKKSTAWRTRLETLVQELDLSDRVTFAHWIPDRLLAAAYARCDAVVLPSEIEGFGLTVLEGWLYGKPAIVSNGVGVSELVHDGINGYSFPLDDAEALAERFDAVLSDDDTSHLLGEAGRRLAARFDTSYAAPREAAILEEAMQRFGGTR